jgi:hypothetical protein
MVTRGKTMSARRKCVMTAALSLALALAQAGASSAEVPAAADAQMGAWQAHKYTFNFFGFTTIYSCNGLEDKLKRLLRLSGAGQEVKVLGSCSAGFGVPDKLALVYLTFSTLQPATVTEAEGGAGGQWRHVSISPGHPHEFERGDCELIEQFRDKVLPLFTVRNIESNVQCVPHQETTNFSLSFDVFAPPLVPKGQTKDAVSPRSAT